MVEDLTVWIVVITEDPCSLCFRWHWAVGALSNHGVELVGPILKGRMQELKKDGDWKLTSVVGH